MINNLVDQLLPFGKVRRGVLGIKGGQLTYQLTKVFVLESKHGAFIYQINSDSPAEQAGLEVGDMIVSLNGLSIISFFALRAKIGSLSVGKS
jgi:S1-C subfamily serine protease